jgi:hypothetical protein
MSKRILIVGIFVLLWFLLALISWNRNKYNMYNIIWSDAEGYYMYLPAVFIHSGFDSLIPKTPHQFNRHPVTKRVFTKYTCGVALMQSPFFAVAHILQKSIVTKKNNRLWKHLLYGGGVFIHFLFALCLDVTVFTSTKMVYPAN